MSRETENLLNGTLKEDDAGSKHGNRRSFTGNSRRDEEELFEDLVNFNEGYEPSFYQTEVKRFETSTNLDRNLGTDGGRSDLQSGIPSNGYSAQLSRKMSLTNSKRKFQTGGIKKGSGIAEKLIRKRKLCRFVSLLGCLSFMAGLVSFLYVMGMMKDALEVDWRDRDISFTLQNCRLFIEPCEDCPQESLELDYRTSISNIFTKILASQATFAHTATSSAFHYSVVHYDDILGCNLYVRVPRGSSLKSVTIDCKESCVVIQQSSHFSTAVLKISGDEVSANFAKVTLGDLDVRIKKGFAQFNNLVPVAGTFSRSILVGSGDIVVESTSPLTVSYETASENYCFAGHSVSETVPAAKQPIKAPLSLFVSQTHLQRQLFEFQWTGQTQVCGSAGCSSASPMTLQNFEGNLYVNVLEAIPGVVAASSAVVKGSRYGNEVDIPLSSQLLIASNLEETYQRTLPNLIIKFVFGNFDAWSIHGSKWVYSDHSIYSVVKPWWLSFFTLGKLVENTNEVKSFLSPGFCPYRHTMSIKENMIVERALSKYLPLKFGVVHFLKPADHSLFPDVNKPDDGFFSFAKATQFSDEWVDVNVAEGENYTYSKVQLTEHSDTFLIICLSVLVSFAVAIKMTYKLVQLLFKSFQTARERLIHIDFYWKIFGKVANANRKNNGVQFNIEEEETGEKKQTDSLRSVNIKLKQSFFDLPSTTAFVDYLIMELWTSGNTSLRRFYEVAFEEADYNKIIDLEMQNLQNEKVPLKQLKSFYQQMCFLMGHKESEFSTAYSLKLLSDKGMVLTNSDSHKQYLIRFNLNTLTDLSLSHIKNEKKKNSLELFLEMFCEQTNFDEDRVPFDLFVERYALFCKLNHMEQVLTDHLILKSEFGIESRTFLKEMVQRDYDQIYQKQPENSKKTGSASKLGFLSSLFKKKTYYNLKVDRIKNVNLFLAGKLNESDVGKKEFTQIVELSIMEDYWYLNDFFAVFIELSINILLSFPFMAIFIFQEIEHSSYSLRDESINIYGVNFGSNDIWLLPKKIFKNTLLLIMFVLFLFFWASSIFNLIANIVKLEFPWIKVFDPNNFSQKKFNNFLNAYQWWFIIASFCGILWYVCLVVIWDTIASIVNSQAYLATTSMAVSFVYMVYSLNKEFTNIWWQSKQVFQNIFKDIWNLRIRVIVKEVFKSIVERHGAHVEQAQGGLKANQIISHEDNLNIIEINLQKVASENPKNRNFIRFFFSLINGDSNLRLNIQKMLMEPPFNFNKYMTQLLCSVLFMSKGSLASRSD